ncbi:hypothetical protein Taro_033488 [Colocasia esculenta]|uniref:Uncharacterized protein n=1 Tax=Colocasia esculenta TaxID=4460 RepID=A0A843W0A4_COLES|nr:hypothetical protein [Colocasia esculenta]
MAMMVVVAAATLGFISSNLVEDVLSIKKDLFETFQPVTDSSIFYLLPFCILEQSLDDRNRESQALNLLRIAHQSVLFEGGIEHSLAQRTQDGRRDQIHPVRGCMRPCAIDDLGGYSGLERNGALFLKGPLQQIATRVDATTDSRSFADDDIRRHVDALRPIIC